MSHSTAQMLSWNYEKAMKFFCLDPTLQFNPTKLQLVNKYLEESMKKCYTYVNDYLSTPQKAIGAMQTIINASKERTLILIDGESGVGKTTFAEKLCEKEGFIHFDMDKRSTELLINHLTTMKTPVVFDLMGTVDQLIHSQLESIILKESNNGKKTVVMSGAFRNVLMRSIIANTVGSRFQKKMSIVVHDTLKDNLARVKEREGALIQEARDMVTSTFEDMEHLHQTALPFYGIGFNASIWVNHQALRDFKFK